MHTAESSEKKGKYQLCVSLFGLLQLSTGGRKVCAHEGLEVQGGSFHPIELQAKLSGQLLLCGLGILDVFRQLGSLQLNTSELLVQDFLIFCLELLWGAENSLESFRQKNGLDGLDI